MSEDEETLVLEAVAATLRYLCDGWMDPKDGEDAKRRAERIETENPSEWFCCPMCSEVVCDDDCPLFPVRYDRGMWREGAPGPWLLEPGEAPPWTEMAKDLAAYVERVAPQVEAGDAIGACVAPGRSLAPAIPDNRCEGLLDASGWPG